jgi:hypothetical protein
VAHRADGSVDVGRVHPGERVTQVDGDAVGLARGEPQYLRSAPLPGRPSLPRAAIAAGQSMAAMTVMPSVILVPTFTQPSRQLSR